MCDTRKGQGTELHVVVPIQSAPVHQPAEEEDFLELYDSEVVWYVDLRC